MLRDLSTDRPDQTESPYTVDAGHLQVEMDMSFFSRDEHNPELEDMREDTLLIAATNFRIGLLSNFELNFIFEPYVNVDSENRSGGVNDERKGFGDVTVRAKVNFWGNDGGKTAFAVLPSLKIPTNSGKVGNNDIEGGVIFPFALELGERISLGTHFGLDFVRNDPGDADKYSTDFVFSAALGIDLGGGLGCYLETFNAINSAGGSDNWTSSFDFGFTYLLNPDLQLDAGVNLGVTRIADDINVFVGLSRRW